MMRQSEMLLIPLVDEARYAKCIVIPTSPAYISDLMQDIAQAKSIRQFDPGFHSVQFYDSNIYWLADWPKGYPLDEEWRLDHTVTGEKRWAEDVTGFIQRCLWQPEMKGDAFAPYITMQIWQADEVRVLVTEGGVNWVALGPCPAYGQCREQQVMEMQVATHCITEEYLRYIPHVAGKLEECQK